MGATLVVRHYGKRGRDARTACGLSMEPALYVPAPSVTIDLRRITCPVCAARAIGDPSNVGTPPAGGAR